MDFWRLQKRIFRTLSCVSQFGELRLDGCLITDRRNTLVGCQTLSQSRLVKILEGKRAVVLCGCQNTILQRPHPASGVINRPCSAHRWLEAQHTSTMEPLIYRPVTNPSATSCDMVSVQQTPAAHLQILFQGPAPAVVSALTHVRIFLNHIKEAHSCTFHSSRSICKWDEFPW